MIFTFEGLIHNCKIKERKIFYDIEMDKKCRFCGDDLTQYQTTLFEITPSQLTNEAEIKNEI